jgi:hypothetical protein
MRDSGQATNLDRSHRGKAHESHLNKKWFQCSVEFRSEPRPAAALRPPLEEGLAALPDPTFSYSAQSRICPKSPIFGPGFIEINVISPLFLQKGSPVNGCRAGGSERTFDHATVL